jgi:hypothetical protein
LLHGVWVGWIGWSDVLDRASLNTNDTDWNTTEASTTDNNGLGPTTEGLNKRSIVKETREMTLIVVLASNEPSYVVRLLWWWNVGDITIPRVNSRANWQWVVALVWNVGHPFNNLGHTLKVIIGSHVRDTVLVHDLGTTKLQVGSVHFTTEKLVDSWSTSQDDWLTLDLNGTLTETDQVGTDTNGSASDKSDGEDVFVGSASSTSNQTGALQTLNTKTILSTNDGGDLVSCLTVLDDLLGDDIAGLAILESCLGLWGQVQVLETSLWPLSIVPCNVEVRDELIGHTDTSTGVGGQVDARNTELTGQFGALVEELVLLWTKGTNSKGDVVGNNDEFTTTWVFWGAGGNNPSNHSVRVSTRLTGDLCKVVLVIKNQLAVVDALSDRWLLIGKGSVLPNTLHPAVLNGLAEELREIVDVLGSHQVSLVTLWLEPLLGRVWGRNRTQVHGADLGGAPNALEDPLAALLGLAFSVHLNLDDVSRSVGDDNTKRVWHAGGWIGTDDTDLSTGDTEAPGAVAETLKEPGKSLLNLLRLEWEDWREVDEDVVQIGVVVANDLQSIENVVHETICLRDQVLGGWDLIAESSWTHDSTGEVALVALNVLSNSLVNVDVAVLSEDWLDAELGQSAKLKLEGQSRLNVTDAVVLDVLGTAEGEVPWVRTILVTADECQTAHTASKKLILVLVNNGIDSGQSLAIISVLGITDGNIADSGELITAVQAWCGRLTLSTKLWNQAVACSALLGTGDREDLESAHQVLLGLVQVLDGNNDTLSRWLSLTLVGQVGHITNGADALEWVHALDGWSSWGRWSGRLHWHAKLGVANLAEDKVPRDNERWLR